MQRVGETQQKIMDFGGRVSQRLEEGSSREDKDEGDMESVMASLREESGFTEHALKLLNATFPVSRWEQQPLKDHYKTSLPTKYEARAYALELEQQFILLEDEFIQKKPGLKKQKAPTVTWSSDQPTVVQLQVSAVYVFLFFSLKDGFRFLNANNRLNRKSPKNEENLYGAARAGNIAQAYFLLDQGVKPYSIGEDGYTSLESAIIQASYPMIKNLIIKKSREANKT